MSEPDKRAMPTGIDRPSPLVVGREANDRAIRRTARDAAQWLRDVVLRYKLRWLAEERKKLPQPTGVGGGSRDFFEHRRQNKKDH